MHGQGNVVMTDIKLLVRKQNDSAAFAGVEVLTSVGFTAQDIETVDNLVETQEANANIEKEKDFPTSKNPSLYYLETSSN